MKFLIVFVALFAVALARPGVDPAQIVSQDVDVGAESYKWGFETSDGTKQTAEGKLNDVGSDHEEIVVHGAYSWVDSEGLNHAITYVADKNGYQPAGPDVPVAA